MKHLLTLTTLACVAFAHAQYQTRVVFRGLDHPAGIVASGRGRSTKLYITQLPTPGVKGVDGGRNTVDVIAGGQLFNLAFGEPEPTNLALAPSGDLYWTCHSAGVILKRDSVSGPISLALGGQVKPSGVAVGADGTVYFTQVPTPGIPGSQGGSNSVNALSGGVASLLHMGEPEPVDIAVHRASNTLYWTCRTAGVILKRDSAGNISKFLGGLNKPTGIAVNQRTGDVLFTEVPTPGLPGSLGGGNFVWSADPVTGAREVVDFGDPEPQDITVAEDGAIYWTCRSAGVIVRAVKRDWRD
jgi:hypothetical protein